MAQVSLARDSAFIAAFDHSRALHGGSVCSLTTEGRSDYRGEV